MQLPMPQSLQTEESRETVAPVALYATVYVAIPVFNRLALTRRCIELLYAQTYPHIEVIVSDGGSTDGTPRVIAQEFPRVTLLTARRELWWAGAMAMAIDHILKISRNRADFVLMMNNDTEFDETYVATLVRTAQETGAAVGALTVDMRDPTVVLDAGEFIDWENYAFPVKTTVAPDERFFDGVDVLPGRGSLVPLHMIRKAGNINHRRFPHYIADYEFFARLKRHGFRLGVSYEAMLRSDPTVTGLFVKPGQKTTLLQAIHMRFARRSMNNVLDHYRFIDSAAPEHLRRHAKSLFIRMLTIRLLDRLRLLPILGAIRRGCLASLWLATPPYEVTGQEISRAGIDALNATKSGLLFPFPTENGIRFLLPVVRTRRRASDASLAGIRQTAERTGHRLSRALLLRWIVSGLQRLVFPIYHITDDQCLELGFDVERLVSVGVLSKDEVPGFYMLRASSAPSALRAYAKSHYYQVRMARRLRMAEMSIKESR